MTTLTKLQDTVAERVRAVMAARRLGLSAVSSSLGISHDALSRRLNGSVAFSIAEIEKFAALTGYKPGDFVAESFAILPMGRAA